MRPLARRIVIVAALPAVAALLPVAAGGCAAKKDAELMPPWQAEDVEKLPLAPADDKFARENFRGAVLSRLRTTRGVTFVQAPGVIATRNRSRNVTELLAAGEVIEPSVTGTQFRRPYTVVWRKAGKGWDLHEVQLDTGVKVEEPLPARPTSRPATAPAAPAPGAGPAADPAAAAADPTGAMPPAGAAPMTP